MNQESKTCQNCKSQFVIEPEDFSFYEKIKVPPPTWCPECRAIRRMVWRNERILYKRKCDAPGHSENLISNYSKDAPFPVYDQEYLWSDSWDPLSYGRDYNFSKTFFEQFKELLNVVPKPNLSNLQAVRSEYCNFTYQSKDCYLNFASDLNENTAYLYHTVYCKNSFDLLGCKNLEYCYEAVHSQQCYQSSYIYFSSQCLNSTLLYNCHSCQNCFGCVNLRNAKYQIFNRQYTKEEYEKEIKNIEDGGRFALLVAAQKFSDLIKKYPHRYATVIHSVNVAGEYITNAKNCQNSFDLEGPVEDSKYVVYGVINIKDCYDGYGVGNGLELGYELTSCGGGAKSIFFSPLCWVGNENQYSYLCQGCSYIFGCAGIKNKDYCILNKQYSKEDYEKLLPKVIKQMDEMPYTDKKGRVYKYGEFFPIELSPFAYNETIVQEYFPLTKEKVVEKGYPWKDPEEKNYQISINSENLPDYAKDITESILKETLGCEHQGKCNEQCTTAFKIIPQELEFYKKMNLPIPKLCPNCRHYERLRQRNPLKLWHRKCQCAGAKSENEVYTNTTNHSHGSSHCSNEFETSYAPERPEIVYCEQCYQSEVV